MRLRSPSHIVSVISLVAGSYCAPAAAQIEFAKSSIRIVDSSESSESLPHRTPPMKFSALPMPGAMPVAREVRAASNTTVDEDLPPAPAPVAEAAPTKQYAVQRADYVAPPPLIHAPIQARAPSTVNVYSSAAAQNTLSKMPGPAPIQMRSTTTAPPKPVRGKPFQEVQSEPVISPYMNLYRNDTSAPTLPNYLTMVRPQQEQLQSSRQQTAELQKLRAQLQSYSGGGSGAPNSASMTAHAHYMDTAQFYRGTRK